MKKLFKILLSSGLMTGMSSIVFATESALTEAEVKNEISSLKPVFFIVLILVIIGILYLSFKLDSPSSGKTKKKTKKSVNEQKVTNNLVEKDVTYEAEAKETYVDENIAPVKVEDDEDEVSLFESYSNPDTLPEEDVTEEEDDVLGKLDSLDEEEDFSKKEETSSLDSFIETPAEEPEETNYDLNSASDLDGDGDETNDFTSGEESDGEGDNAFDSYDLNNNGIDDTEETIEDTDSFSETMVFDSYDLNSEEKTEEDQEEPEEEVVEEEEEKEENNYNIPQPQDDDDFGGFTTIKRNSVPSPEFSARKAANAQKEEKKEIKKETKKEVKPAAEEEPEVDSASMFLRQMEANLSGAEPAPKKVVAKKTTTKKATPAKKETKTATKKTATKKTTTKTTAAKKTTTTKKSTKK